MIGAMMGVSDQQFKLMMEERKVLVAEFIIHSIKNEMGMHQLTKWLIIFRCV